MMVQDLLLERQIMLIQKGDSDAFHVLYENTKSAVYGFALSRVKNRHDAEDIMHDTYLKVYRSVGSYEPMGKPLAWILTIARNLCFNRIRDTKYADDISDHLERTESSGPDCMNQVEDRILIDILITSLSEEEREIVILHVMTGWKHREIAEWMGLPLSTVLSKYNRALKKMREELEGKRGALNDRSGNKRSVKKRD